MDSPSPFVNQPRDALDSTTMSETTDGGLGDSTTMGETTDGGLGDSTTIRLKVLISYTSHLVLIDFFNVSTKTYSILLQF